MDHVRLTASVGKRPVWQWDISHLHERRHSHAVPDDVIEGVAMCLGRSYGYIDPRECGEAVELLFWALHEDGWQFYPPASAPQSSDTVGN